MRYVALFPKRPSTHMGLLTGNRNWSGITTIGANPRSLRAISFIRDTILPASITFAGAAPGPCPDIMTVTGRAGAPGTSAAGGK